MEEVHGLGGGSSIDENKLSKSISSTEIVTTFYGSKKESL